MKIDILVLILIIFILLITFSFATEGIVTVSLNTSRVWWNDSVNASGKATYAGGNPISGTVSIGIDNKTYSCPSTNPTTGAWNCVFNAPIEIGEYTVLVNVTNSTGSSFTNTTSLSVIPNYGSKPIGTIDRVVYEIPILIQDLDGKIKQVWARVMVWRG